MYWWYLGEKGRLSDSCYRESEVFFWTHESAGAQGLSLTHHLGPSSFSFLKKAFILEHS
jgi:hypothetical protein